MISKIFDGPYFAYHDTDKENNKHSPYPLSAEEAHELNRKGYAIAVYVNDLGGGRTNNCCRHIRAWFTDIDYGEAHKPDLDDLLEASPLLPSLVVNTRNGFHLYWTAGGSPDIKHWKQQQRAIIAFYGGDVKCANEARGLRSPGFFHMKGTSPYMVEIAWQLNVSYSPQQLFWAFPFEETEEVIEQPVYEYKRHTPAEGEGIFDRIFNHDQLEILQRLSGTSAVQGKQYRFDRQASGHFNIIVNGKDSGCFINKARKIIASPGYQPCSVKWLGWYGLSRVDAAKAICEVMGWEYKL